MGALGGIIDNAVDAVTGKSSGTTLQDFLSHFSSSEGIWIKQIDPLATFDLSFKFHPSDWKKGEDGKWYEKLGTSLLNSAKGAVKNLANNVTGGILGSIMNSQVKIQDIHNENPGGTTKTFMEYLASANLLVGKEDWVGEKAGETVSPLELQLGLYCQEITVPGIEMALGPTSQSLIGEFPVNGTYVKTDSQLLSMKLLNTKVPLCDRIFYPWLREVTAPWWSYDSQPYTTATITIDFTKHSDLKYIFLGCRPQKIISMQAAQQASFQNLTRDVYFVFDAMFIQSSLTNCESLTDKLLSTGKTLFNSAAKMVQL